MAGPVGSQDPTDVDSHGADSLGFIEAFIFPFRQRNWLSSIWWVPIFVFVPIVGLWAIEGWRLDIIRRVERGDEILLPEAKDIGRFLAQGFFLLIMAIMYLIPGFFLVLFFGIDSLSFIWTIIVWLFLTVFSDQETVSLGVLLWQALREFVLQSGFIVIYPILAGLVFTSGMIRYTARGQKSAFFAIHTNIILILRHANAFLLDYFLVIVVGILTGLLSLVLALTVVGALLIPIITVPLYYWTTGHLYGHLATEVALKANQ